MKVWFLLLVLVGLPAQALNIVIADEMRLILNDPQVRDYVDFDDSGFMRSIEFVRQGFCNDEKTQFIREYALVLDSASPVRKERTCRFKVTVDDCVEPQRVNFDNTPICK